MQNVRTLLKELDKLLSPVNTKKKKRNRKLTNVPTGQWQQNVVVHYLYKNDVVHYFFLLICKSISRCVGSISSFGQLR